MRIRTIKPEFFKHEGLFDAEAEEGLPLRLAFIGLWCAADREGRFKWRPRALGVSILPYDNVDFARVLDALSTRGLIVKYAAEGVDYGCIPSFERHQHVNAREKASEIPPPPESAVVTEVSTRAPRVTHASATRHVHARGEGKGREGNKEGKGKTRAREDELPPTDPDWRPYAMAYRERYLRAKPKVLDYPISLREGDWIELERVCRPYPDPLGACAQALDHYFATEWAKSADFPVPHFVREFTKYFDPPAPLKTREDKQDEREQAEAERRYRILKAEQEQAARYR